MFIPKGTVIVVDDDHAVAETLVEILKSAGFSASAAYDAEGALALARIASPCVLIADISLPGMDGIELASAVRRIASDCRVLICTGVTTEAHLSLPALQFGSNIVFLTKPIHPSELLVHVLELLSEPRAA